MLVLSSTAVASASDLWFARCGTLDTAHHDAYKTVIDGLVADGVWSTLDALYVFATDTASNAKLNLVSSSYPLIQVGAPSFIANSGYTGTNNSNNDYFDTGFNPNTAGGHFTLNSATIALWSFTDTSSGNGPMGAFDGSNITDLHLRYLDGTCYCEVNSIVSQRIAAAVSGTTGSFVVTRTGGTTTIAYRNASSIGSSSAASTSLINLTLWIIARNETASVSTPWQISVAVIAGGWTSTQVTAFYNRLATYLDTIHGSH